MENISVERRFALGRKYSGLLIAQKSVILDTLEKVTGDQRDTWKHRLANWSREVDYPCKPLAFLIAEKTLKKY